MRDGEPMDRLPLAAIRWLGRGGDCAPDGPIVRVGLLALLHKLDKALVVEVPDAPNGVGVVMLLLEV